MESPNQLVAMLRLLGLLTCVSLAFIFPILAYDLNERVMSDAVISTTIGTVVISILLK
jgi:hypothetical protein